MGQIARAGGAAHELDGVDFQNGDGDGRAQKRRPESDEGLRLMAYGIAGLRAAEAQGREPTRT
jgi:hypothetical protein